MTGKLSSKILVLDDDPRYADALKSFCERNDLVGLRARKDRLMDVLASTIDLGAVLYSEAYGDDAQDNAAIARRIHALRPELPLILRRDGAPTLDDLDPGLRPLFCAAYSGNDVGRLRTILDEYLFSLVYPNALVRGIAEISEAALSSQFPGYRVRRDTPYIVRDRIIFGEVFSLIRLESAWCRGYMTLQTEERPILENLAARNGVGYGDFRAVNDHLGEITNLIWGAFRNRYVGDELPNPNAVEVPLIVNHAHRYISFGTDNPQLCFLHTLADDENGRSFRIYQRFVFNLNWSPEDFREVEQEAQRLVEAGELEIF